MQKEWFAEWFDSPYYHLLYRGHDESDARHAVSRLASALQLAPEARVLDLACGKGRHAIQLAQAGYDVTGLDISAASITAARAFENDRLAFYQHDMRLPFRMNYFDAVVNFFTSFGYFDNDADHLRTLVNISKGLRDGGVFLLDYFNAEAVIENLIAEEIKTEGGIPFYLRRYVNGGYVVKEIEFEAEGRRLHFSESVRLFRLADFETLFSRAGLRITASYGGYDLQPFEAGRSSRLILIAVKHGLA